MTEIQYLLSILMGEYKVSPALKKSLLARIGEVEEGLRSAPQPRQQAPQTVGGQSPSTQRILQNNPDLVPAVIAQTPEAQKALADRAALMNAAMNESAPRSRGPRKF